MQVGREAAAFVLRAVSKHSPQLAQAVVDSGALEALVSCLEEFDPSVKEALAPSGRVGRRARQKAGVLVLRLGGFGIARFER